MAAKRYKAGGRISLSSEEDDESDTGNDTDPDQMDPDRANDKYPLEL